LTGKKHRVPVVWKMAAPMSDIAGYRADGGGLGQDQGVSKQLKGILTAKLPLLSAPGTVLENSLYYDINSSSVTAVEEQATFCKDRIAFNNFAYGSTPSAYIPSVLFANTLFWVVAFPEDCVAPTGQTAQNAGKWLNIPQGWGFNAFRNLIVYMGASSIAQIQISAVTNFLVCLATCETYEKRQRMITGAGAYVNPCSDTSACYCRTAGANLWRFGLGPDNWYTTNGGPTAGRITRPYMRQAVVPLRVPWSSMAVLDKRLSFDTKLSTQPVQIALQTNPLTEIITCNSEWIPAFKSGWDYSTLQLWQEELSDKSLSVRNELLAQPEFNVGYPFQYAQSIPFDISGRVYGGGETGVPDYITVQANISSIINSDLTTFLFNVTWNGRTNPNGGQFCPLFGERLINIELLLNGQRFFAFNDNDYSYVTLAKHLDSPGYEIIIPHVNYNVGKIPLDQRDFVAMGSYYEFNNSRLRSIIAESHLQNTARFTNQTFQLKFDIVANNFSLLEYGTLDAALASCYSSGYSRANGYTLNMTYLYNAVYLVGGDGGTTKLITN